MGQGAALAGRDGWFCRRFFREGRQRCRCIWGHPCALGRRSRDAFGVSSGRRGKYGFSGFALGRGRRWHPTAIGCRGCREGRFSDLRGFAGCLFDGVPGCGKRMVPESPGDGSQKHGGESRESGISDQNPSGASGHFTGNKLPERAMGIMGPQGIRGIAFEFLKRF